MDRKDIIKELLDLSKVHLKATMEEDWAIWERTIRQKEVVYREAERLFKEGILQEEEEKLLHEISTLEDRTKNELLRKRDETGKAILHGKLTRAGLRSYKQGQQKPDRRRLSIKC